MPDTNTQAAGGGEGQSQTTQATGKTFTQSELDAIITDRLGRERAKFADYDTIKAEHEQLKKAQMTEAERATARITELEKAQADKDAKIQKMVVQNGVMAAAATLGALYPKAVYKLVDLDKIKFDESGEPSNLDKVLEDTRKEYPEMFKAGPAPRGNAGTGANQNGAGSNMNSFIRTMSGRG